MTFLTLCPVLTLLSQLLCWG